MMHRLRHTFSSALACLLLLGLVLSSGAPTQAAGPNLLIGKPAPLLSGRAAFGAGLINLSKLQKEIVYERDANGQPVREGNRLKFKVVHHAVVLNFFATYCVPCIREIPVYNKVARSYEGRPVKFLYVNVDTEKDAKTVRAFAREKGIEVEMMLPSVRYAVKAFAIDSLPRIIVVNGDGIITHVIEGFHDDLAAQIDELLAEVLPKGQEA